MDEKMIFLQAWALSTNSQKVGIVDDGDLIKGRPAQLTMQRTVQMCGRVVLPIITAAFVISYCMSAAYFYTHPNLKYL